MKDRAAVCTVLIAGQSHEDHTAIHAILSQSGWRLDQTATSRETIERCREGHVLVVICNCDLPGGGWQAVVEGIGDLPNPPALIVSSRFVDERLWAEVLNRGGYDVFQTPFEASEVLRVLQLALSSWTYRQSRKPPRRVISEPADGKAKLA